MATLRKSSPAQFKLHAPQAKRVSVVGNFNNWDTAALNAKKDSRGNWIAKTNLKPGKYEYKFFVDGNWMNDPSCNACVSNTFGTQNCVVEVK